jgi:hypothetical protein
MCSADEAISYWSETLFLPGPGLEQNAEDHQMGSDDHGRVKGIDIPEGGQVEVRDVQVQDAAHPVEQIDKAPCVEHPHQRKSETPVAPQSNDGSESQPRRYQVTVSSTVEEISGQFRINHARHQ